MEQMTIRRLSLSTLFKLNIFGLFFGLLPLMILFGVMGMLGMETVTWNEEVVTGPAALLVSPLIGVIMTLIFTLFLSPVIWLGLWIASKFKTFHIRYEA